MKEGASVLGAELTEGVAVSLLESDCYLPFIIPISAVLMCQVEEILPCLIGGVGG